MATRATKSCVLTIADFKEFMGIAFSAPKLPSRLFFTFRSMPAHVKSEARRNPRNTEAVMLNAMILVGRRKFLQRGPRKIMGYRAVWIGATA